MRPTIIAFAILLALAAAAHAQIWIMSPASQNRGAKPGGGGATNFLLADTGNVLLVNTGNKFLVQ